jgi:hypothetical protein
MIPERHLGAAQSERSGVSGSAVLTGEAAVVCWRGKVIVLVSCKNISKNQQPYSNDNGQKMMREAFDDLERGGMVEPFETIEEGICASKEAKAFPGSPEVRMVVPGNQSPLPIAALTDAEGRVFQYKKMVDAIEQLRTDLLPRHHVAYQHAQEGPVRDDEHFPLTSLRQMFQRFERTQFEVKVILFI